MVLKYRRTSADNHIMLWRRTRRREDVLTEHHVADGASEYELNTRTRLRGLSGYDFDESEAQDVEARHRRLNYGAKVEDNGDW